MSVYFLKETWPTLHSRCSGNEKSFTLWNCLRGHNSLSCWLTRPRVFPLIQIKQGFSRLLVYFSQRDTAIYEQMQRSLIIPLTLLIIMINTLILSLPMKCLHLTPDAPGSHHPHWIFFFLSPFQCHNFPLSFLVCREELLQSSPELPMLLSPMNFSSPWQRVSSQSSQSTRVE